jgi:hypothetical protein
MKGDTLSVFIEANRFPPAINERRYSILRAETDAVAERMLIIANKKRLSKTPHLYEIADMSRFSGNHIYELEANEIPAVNQCPPQSLDLPVLPRISVMSAFNPFDQPISSPPSPVPNQLKPASDTNNSASIPLSAYEPPTNYLPFIAPTAPFDPYKQKYEPHPAGLYGAKKFKNRQTMSSAPFGFERPVTPTFSDTNSSFLRFSDASSSVESDQAVAGSECSPSTSRTSCSPPRTPLFRPFKIPRKPLPPGAKPFPPVSYTPPGSPVRHRNTNTSSKISGPVPQRSRRAISNTTRSRPLPPTQNVRQKPRLDLHKPLPPSPSPAPPTNKSEGQRPATLNHHARPDQEERRISRPSNRGMQSSNLRSPEIIPGPVTAADRVRSELRDVKERVLDRVFKLRRL